MSPDASRPEAGGTSGREHYQCGPGVPHEHTPGGYKRYPIVGHAVTDPELIPVDAEGVAR